MADSGQARAGLPEQTAAAPAGMEAQSLAEFGYTFDHETTLQIYGLLSSGSTRAIEQLCQSFVPASFGPLLCPMLAQTLPSLALTEPQAGDRLHVTLQFGWPPLLVEYVK